MQNTQAATIDATQIAMVMQAFTYDFILAVETHLLGGEFRKGACHETLDKPQTKALGDALFHARYVIDSIAYSRRTRAEVLKTLGAAGSKIEALRKTHTDAKSAIRVQYCSVRQETHL
jgi:hypothetical protein